MDKIEITTQKKNELVDITDRVNEIIKKASKGEICVVFAPHATAGIIVNEPEQGLKEDFLGLMARLVPQSKYKHDEVDDNAESHLKSAIIGPSVTIPIENGALALGAWQRILLFETDGPRSRKIFVVVK